MTLTDQIAALFTKHDHKHRSKEAWRQALMADLVALWTRPSQEKLKELLRQFHNDQLNMTEPGWVEKWLSRFMDLATQPAKPTAWCKDWQWDDRDQLWWPTDSKHENHVDSDYQFCEWCGAKRPDPVD